MTLNNSKSVINLKIARRTSIILLLAFLLLTYVAKIIKFPLLGINQAGWTILILACFLIIIFLPLFLNYQYVYFTDEGETIIFRYYTAGFIEGKKNSIEINKRTFSGFTLEKRFFGLDSEYKALSTAKKGCCKISSCLYQWIKTRRQRAKILKSLNSFAPQVKVKTSGNMS